MTNEQIRQNNVNFGPKFSPEIENVPQTEFAVFAAFRDSVPWGGVGAAPSHPGKAR